MTPTVEDLLRMDPSKAPACAALDRLIARRWMKWKWNTTYLVPVTRTSKTGQPHWRRPDDTFVSPAWSPSTNPGHAGEARRKAVRWELQRDPFYVRCRIRDWWGICTLSETNGDRGKAEALATARAILAAVKAQGEESDA